jgi:hypothetical protein
MKKLNLAPEITFSESEHLYTKNGVALSGVTGTIARRLGIKMPEEFVGEARLEGVHVHKSVEMWIRTGCQEITTIHSGVVWLTSTFLEHIQGDIEGIQSEVLVSDGERYASAIDIVVGKSDGTLELYDIKRSFKRQYVTLQLSIYKYLVEKYGYKVSRLGCIAIKDRKYYDIFPRPDSEVVELLYTEW